MTLHTVQDVQYVHTVHTVHTVQAVHTVHIVHTVHTAHTGEEVSNCCGGKITKENGIPMSEQLVALHHYLLANLRIS